jgi:cytochrome c6
MQPGAALTKADMLRNSALEVQVVYSIIYSGKGKMYGFGENCTPKGQCTFGPKLTDAQVQGLAEYVIEKAEKGW